MTLIELLVVIVIVTTIVAAAIPLVSPSNDSRRLREATRGLNTYIFGAQTRAIALNRPVGIALKRLSLDTQRTEDNALAVEVFYVEQLPPYSGFDESPCVRVCIDPDSTAPRGQVLIQFVHRGSTQNDFLPAGWDHDILPSKLFRRGDVIEVAGNRFTLTDTDNLDPPYSLTSPNGYFTSATGTPDGTLAAMPLNDSGQLMSFFDRDLDTNFSKRFWTPPVAYKILRQPTPTSDPPYQMPEGTAIDLRASGVGINDYFYVPGLNDNSTNVLIMFAPEGRVSRVNFSQSPNSAEAFDQPVVDNLYLLVGRRENAPPPEVGADSTLNASSMSGKTDEEMTEMKKTVNWLLGESRWIAIGAQSGRIVTVENAFVDPQAMVSLGVSQTPPISEGTEQLRNLQIQKARQFTREMSQLGGR